MASNSKANLLSDYMYERRVFTLDPQYFPINRMREIINYLHTHNQQYGKRPPFNPGLVPLISRVNKF